MDSVQLLSEAQFHGARRLVFSKYRFYWALALTVLFCCSLSVLSVTINRYFENPTYVAQIDAKEGLKPFPTVVVCPEVEFPEYKIYAFLDSLKYPPGLNASSMAKILPQLGAFFSPDVNFIMRDLEQIQYLLDYNDVDIETAGRRLTLSCAETIIRCRWLQKTINCSTVFSYELTSYGICCVFNGLSLKREIKTYGVHRMNPTRKLFVGSVGFSNSLMLVINQSASTFRSLDLSYKWLVLQGAQYTDIIYNGTPVSPSVETWAAYDSKMLQVTNEAENLNAELRHCRTNDDQLQYFPYYHEYQLIYSLTTYSILFFNNNKSYCLLECEMIRIRQHCNCVQVLHPYQNGLPICTTKHLPCVRQAAVTFSGKDNCRCPPSCDTETETVTVMDYDLVKDAQEYDDFYAGLNFENISIVRVYILQHSKKIYKRQSFITFIRLFSQLGGIFSVFFGCSVLSLLEFTQLAWHAIQDFYHYRRTKEELKFVK